MAIEDYEVVIGLEVHVELSTKTKIFCSCSTEFGGEPNSNTCPVCLSLPGALPVLNEKVVEYAVKAGIATNCRIPKYCWQDRKNYFYPDVSSGYQVSQAKEFICQDGYIEIETDEGEKEIRLHEIHIEEDMGKLFHDVVPNATVINYNRAGVPLIEIVSEPDMRSAKEVDAYLRTLKSICECIEVSDCKMEEGSMRADVNISVRKKGDTKFGNKIEIKNMISYKFIAKAIQYETNRQIRLLEEGKEVVSETMKWDEQSQMTISMREKDSLAYRPFPDPELMPIVLTDEYVEDIRKNLPEMPKVKKKRYMEDYELPEEAARIITSSKYLSIMFEDAVKICGNSKLVSNWIISDITRIIKEQDLEPSEIPFSSTQLGSFVKLIADGTISSKIAKDLLEEMFKNPENPEDIIKAKGWIQISDEGEIKQIVLKILEDNPQSIIDYKAGRDRALGFLVGQAMKQTKGKANPGMLNEMFLEELKK